MFVTLFISQSATILQVPVNFLNLRTTFLFLVETTYVTRRQMDKQVFIKNFGCSSNTADGETLAGCLAQAGFKITLSENDADLIIYNTCAVKGPTENRIINEIKNTPKGKKIILTGCLPKVSFERLKKETRFDAATGPAIGKKIVDIVRIVITGQTIVNIETITKPLLNLPKQRSNPIISIIPINYGCLGSCSYCCVFKARGRLQSHSIKEISERIRSDYAEGAKEFWLTSQDTASYGRDLKTNIAELLFALDQLQGDFQLRVGMMTPNLVIDIQDQLISSFESKKVFKFLHLPIQSGDNSVLQDMHRFYTVAEFKQIVKEFKAKFPDLSLSTDIIVGFPGETWRAFQNTLQVIKEVKPDVVNVSKFFARPKTAALKISDGIVDKEEIKRRSSEAAKLVKLISAKRNKRWLGWSGRVLVDEKGKVKDTWITRNFAYKPIVIRSNENLLGKTIDVTVTETLDTYLKGRMTK
jgi:threonylcarbamoyladenosine tRNA methylthiotransferase CDKAL1